MYLLELKRDGQQIYDGAVALAAQVYVQQHLDLDETVLFPYFCDPHIQIGRYQNTIEEVNMAYLEENNIGIVRRDTGGGAIYIDRGSANLCFLTATDSTDIFSSYDKMYQPVIKAFEALGLENVSQSGRNDLTLDGKKISGAAMTIVNGRVYGGFSMLLNVDFENMVKSLNPNEKKIISKGIKSVKARVNEIRPHLPAEYQDIDPIDFCYRVIELMFDLDSINDLKRYDLTEEDWAHIDQIVAEKYKNWEWNFGKSPRYEMNKDGRTSAGTVDLSLSVSEGRIEKIKIYGDFFGQAPISELEELLVGSRMQREDISEKLANIPLDNYMKNMKAEELVELILE